MNAKATRIPRWTAYRDLFAAAQKAHKPEWTREQLVEALENDAEMRLYPKCTYSKRSTEYWETEPGRGKRTNPPRSYRAIHLHQWLSEHVIDARFAPHLESIAPSNAKPIGIESKSECAGTEALSISQRLKSDLLAIGLDSRIMRSVEILLADRLYPTRMVIDGAPVRNPIWNHIPKVRREQLLADYPLSEVSAPCVMHLDLFLIRANDNKREGKLWTYYSDKEWETYLIPFREKKSAESPECRAKRNIEHVARYTFLPAKTLSITPIAGKFAISAKEHPTNRDLTIYIFEFCSVACDAPIELVRKAFQETRKQGNRKSGRWVYLQEMRANVRAQKVNGDVWWSIHRLFTLGLGLLPTSVPDGLLLEKRIRARVISGRARN